MRDEVIEILLMIRPQLDVDAEDLNIVDELEAEDMSLFITELENQFDIEITMEDRIKENFENIDTIIAMLERLQ